MFKLADLFVSIRADDSAMKAQVGGLKSDLSAVGVAIATVVGNIVTSAIGKATSALAGFISTGIKGSVELQDTMQAVGVVFGSSGKIISDASDDMARKFGIVKGEFVGAASTFGQVFQGLGKNQEDAAKMGVTLAKLGLDLKSFKGGATTTADAMLALQGAFKGEFNMLENFNIFINAAKIESHALAMGLAKTSTALTDVDKKMATLDLIMKQTTNQQGDLARTFDQTGNTYSAIMGSMINLSVKVADALGPAMTLVLEELKTTVTALKIAWEENEKAFTAGVESTVKGAQTSAGSIGFIGDAVGNIANAWRAVSIAFDVVQLKMTQLVKLTATYADQILHTLIPGLKLLTDALGAKDKGKFQKAFVEDLDQLIKKQEIELGELANKPWPKDAMQEYFRKAHEEAAKLKSEIQQVPNAIGAMAGGMGVIASQMKSPMKPDLLVKKAEKKEADFKSETVGVAEYHRKLEEDILSKDKSIDVAKKTLTAAERTAKATENVVGALAGGLVFRLK